jgi:TolB protein
MKAASRFWLGFCGLLFLSFACGLPNDILGRSPFGEASSGQSGLIAYIGNDGNIYTADRGGDNRRAITEDAQFSPDSEEGVRFYQAPTWSPDGKRLAFIGTDRHGGRTESVGLYTTTPDGQGFQQAYSSDEYTPFYLYWAPDSERISFLSSGVSGNDLFLQLVSAQGGEAQILGTGQPYYWVWSPDTQRIFTHTGGSATFSAEAQISFIHLEDDGREDDLGLRPGVFQAPDWSPDGSELLFSAETDNGERAIFLADQDGSVNKILASASGAVALSWSPVGNRIAYLADPNPATQLLTSALTIIDPGQPEDAITSVDDQVVAYFWAPDGERIAYFVPVIDGPGDELVQTEGSDPILRLNLRVLSVETGESGDVALFVPTTQLLNIIPFFDQYQRSVTIWSPDGNYLVYSAVDADEVAGIYVVEVGSDQPPTRIADGRLAFWSWK